MHLFLILSVNCVAESVVRCMSCEYAVFWSE